MCRPRQLQPYITVTHGKVAAPRKSSFLQPINRAKLHITTLWKKARAECEAKVKAIAKQCRDQNRKFRDIEFDLELDTGNCLYGLNPPSRKTDKPVGVRRVTQIFEKPNFFIDGAGTNDVVQGALGNCWFISALATMTASKGLIEEFCVERDEVVGVYGFVFFRNMIPVTVIIDDLLFVSIPKFAELSDEARKLCHNDEEWFNRDRRRGGRTLHFSRSRTEGETWVPLIEKAFAKLHGDYASLSAGVTGEAIEDMTGGVSFLIPTKDILDPDRFWKEELLEVNKYRLFGCSTVGPNLSRSHGKGEVKMQGITGEHAYSVIRAAEFKEKRFVLIRDPWGAADSEWTGPWSDGSKEWTSEWLPALGKDVLNHRIGEDGEFVMEYSDFLEKWEFVDRTLLFDETWIMSSQWLKVTTRSYPAPWSYGDVSFTISLNAESRTIIVLSQLDPRYYIGITGQYEWTFDFVLFRKGEKEALASSSHSRFCARSVNLEINLLAGEYVVHVRLDRHRREHDNTPPIRDGRKLSKVLVERAKSQSLASNFRTDQRAAYLPIPLEELAGQDIKELEQKALDASEEMRKRNEALHVVEETKLMAAGPTEEEEVVQEATSSSSEAPVVTITADASVIAESQPIVDDSLLIEKTGSACEPENGTGGELPTTQALAECAIGDDRDTVYLGLHVYTQNTRSEVHGQLRYEMGVGFDGLAVSGL